MKRIACALFAAAMLVVAGCTRPYTQTESQGRALYAAQCSPCHEAASTARLTVVPPKLRGLFKRATLPDGATPVTDAAVRDVILNGRGTMPPFAGRFSDEQLAALLAYLHRK